MGPGPPVRIDLLQEQEEGQATSEITSQVETCTLAHPETSSKKYCGRMWRIGNSWELQNNGTGISVSVSMDNAADCGRRGYFQRRDAKLLKAMNVMHEQGRAKLRNQRRAEVAKKDMP